jgi:hypothetical protein
VPDVDFFDAQVTIMKMLVEDSGIEIACTQDWLGNTPLHFLASGRLVNDNLIAWLRKHPEADDRWKNTKNEFGHRPKELWLDYITVVEPGIAPQRAGERPARRNFVAAYRTGKDKGISLTHEAWYDRHDEYHKF